MGIILPDLGGLSSVISSISAKSGNRSRSITQFDAKWTPKDTLIVPQNFESDSQDVMDVWRRIHGEDLTLTVHPNCQQ